MVRNVIKFDQNIDHSIEIMMKTSVFESRERLYFKQCIEESHRRIQVLQREIEEAKTKDERQCCVKRYLEYIKLYPLLLFEHVGFRIKTMKMMKEEKSRIRIERVLAHQRYHKKHPRERGTYESELGRYVIPIECLMKEIGEIIREIHRI